MFALYFERYKNKFRPKHIVFIYEEYVVGEINGIKIERFQEFKPNNKDIYPIICSINIR